MTSVLLLLTSTLLLRNFAKFVCCLPGDRTERLVNPHAWDKGLVYLQCKGCEVWHKFKDNANLVEEIYLADSQ